MGIECTHILILTFEQHINHFCFTSYNSIFTSSYLMLMPFIPQASYCAFKKEGVYHIWLFKYVFYANECGHAWAHQFKMCAYLCIHRCDEYQFLGGPQLDHTHIFSACFMHTLINETSGSEQEVSKGRDLTYTFKRLKSLLQFVPLYYTYKYNL